MEPDATDEALLRAAARRPEAFGEFYRRHEAAMLVFLVRRTRDAEAEADLTAGVFAAALQSAHRFRPGPRPAVAWLYAIAHHKLASSRRRAGPLPPRRQDHQRGALRGAHEGRPLSCTQMRDELLCRYR